MVGLQVSPGDHSKWQLGQQQDFPRLISARFKHSHPEQSFAFATASISTTGSLVSTLRDTSFDKHHRHFASSFGARFYGLNIPACSSPTSLPIELHRPSSGSILNPEDYLSSFPELVSLLLLESCLIFDLLISARTLCVPKSPATTSVI
jgi:hypothetical protein